MNRRRLLLAGSTLPALWACSRQSADAGLDLTATDVHPANYPTVLAMQWLGDQLEKQTNGRYRLRHYHSGQLGRESDTIDSARFGVIDFCRVYSGGLNNAFPLTAALCLPYSFDSVAHLRRALDGPLGAEVLAGFDRRELVGLAIYDSGARNFYNARRPVRSPADLLGMKMRVPQSDMFMDLLKLFGANPTPLAYGAVYSALETHLIDGAENNIRSFHSSRHFEAARYWSRSEHCYAPDILLISKRRLQSLPGPDQELIRHLARESVQVMRELWDEGEAAAREAVMTAGVETVAVDLTAFKRAAQPLITAYRRDPEIDRLYHQIREVA